jgi:hypothetical protein
LSQLGKVSQDLISKAKVLGAWPEHSAGLSCIWRPWVPFPMQRKKEKEKKS